MSDERSIRDELSDLVENSRTPMGGTLLGSRVQFESIANAILASPVIRRTQAEARIAFADRLTRMGVHTFNIHDIRKYAAEQEVEHE